MMNAYDFEADIEHLAVFGICGDCRGDRMNERG